MVTQSERAGFLIAMRSMAFEKREALEARRPEIKAHLALLRRWKRGHIEAYRDGYKNYPAVRREVREIAKRAWDNRLGKSIMDQTIVRPDAR